MRAPLITAKLGKVPLIQQVHCSKCLHLHVHTYLHKGQQFDTGISEKSFINILPYYEVQVDIYFLTFTRMYKINLT